MVSWHVPIILTNVLSKVEANIYIEGRKEEEMFYLKTHSTHFTVIWHQTYDKGSLSMRGNMWPPLHGLFFLISSKGSFICTIPETG